MTVTPTPCPPRPPPSATPPPTLETLLIATDGSAGAQVAERYAVAFAQQLNAALACVSVVDERSTQVLRAPTLGIPDGPVEAVEQFLHARAEAAVRRVTEHAEARGVSCSASVQRGNADDCIVENGRHADLLLLGRTGAHAKPRSPLLGASSSGVLCKTRKPVLVTPAEARFCGPLLLAFDGSPGACIAARMAAELATRLREPLHAFVDSKDKRRARARFADLRRRLGALPVAVHERPSTLGRPDVKIVETAREVGAGLIVMGAYGRNRISDYFLGSNATVVARTTPVAVLLAR